MAEQEAEASNPLMDALSSITDDFDPPREEGTEESSEEEEGAETEEETSEESEEESEEGTSEEGEEESEEDNSEEEEETKEEESDEEEKEDARTVPLEALHAERAKRQEADKANTALKADVTDRDSQLKSIKDQLKELDLEDVIKIESAPELSPEATEALAEKRTNDQKAETEKVFKGIQTEVGDRKVEYKNIDYANNEQGEALMGMIVSSMFFGSEMEDAVKSSMGQLDTLMKASFDAGKKGRAAPVKPKAKPTTRSRRVAKDTRAVAMGKAIKSGNFDDVLDGFANDLVKE